MEIKGLSVRGDYSYSIGGSGGTDWTLTGTGINANIDSTFDDAGLFWGQFRLFYHTSSGDIKQGSVALGSVDDFNIGIATLAGLRFYLGNDIRITGGIGFAMSFGSLNVNATDAGDDKWEPDCGGFQDIVDDPNSISCFLGGMDGTYSSRKLLTEIGVEWGPLLLAVSLDYSWNSRKKDQVMTDLFRFGVGGGLKF